MLLSTCDDHRMPRAVRWSSDRCIAAGALTPPPATAPTPPHEMHLQCQRVPTAGQSGAEMTVAVPPFRQQSSHSLVNTVAGSPHRVVEAAGG